jgi:methoxymalonate biosynthesis acyl carrier protein
MTMSDTDSVTETLLRFLESRTKLSWTPDQDLFASGVVSSLFAIELVVFVEQTFGLAVDGPDLTLDNFRSARAIAELVARSRA